MENYHTVDFVFLRIPIINLLRHSCNNKYTYLCLQNGVINTASQIMGQWKDQAAREESLPFGDLSQSSLPFSAYDPQKQAEAAAHSLQPQSLPSMYGFDVTPSLDVGAVTSNTGQGLGPLSPGLPSLTDGYSYFN